MSTQIKFLHSLFLLLLVHSLGACTYLQETIGWGIQRPTAKLESVSIKKISDQSVHLQITLQVQNPNSFNLKLSDINYQLHINKALVAIGSHRAPLEIHSRENKIVKIPLEVDIKRSLHIVQYLLKGQKRQMKAYWEATAFFKSSLGSIKLAFQDEKQLT